MLRFSIIVERVGDPRVGRLGDVPAGPAFLYLFRRFGFPASGSDAHKEVCVYYFPLAVEGTFLRVFVGGRHAWLGIALSPEVHNALIDQAVGTRVRDERTELGQQILDAAEVVFRDLFRPVFVRDIPINLLGEVTEEAKVGAVVERSQMAGYGVPRGCYDNPVLFLEAVREIRDLGGGSIPEGLQKVLELIKQQGESLCKKQ